MVVTVDSRINPLDSIGVAADSGHGSLDCLRQAGMDYDVQLFPVKNAITGEVVMGPPRIIKGKKGVPDQEVIDPRFFQVIRTDTQEVLGQVESRYTTMQNRDVFAVTDDLREAGWKITRASCIDGGARAFMHLEDAKDKAISIVGDIVGRRAIIHTSHDGKFATSIQLVPLALACTNGMVVPVPGMDMSWAIRHTVNGDEKLMEANEILRLADKYFASFQSVAERMAQTPVNMLKAQDILLTTKGLTNKESKVQTAKRNGILALFNGGQRAADHESRRNTAWGLLNAGAELADHGEASRVRITAGNDENVQRFKSAFGGAGRTLKMGLYDSMVQDADLGLGEYLKQLAQTN